MIFGLIKDVIMWACSQKLVFFFSLLRLCVSKFGHIKAYLSRFACGSVYLLVIIFEA